MINLPKPTEFGETIVVETKNHRIHVAKATTMDQYHVVIFDRARARIIGSAGFNAFQVIVASTARMIAQDAKKSEEEKAREVCGRPRSIGYRHQR